MPGTVDSVFFPAFLQYSPKSWVSGCQSKVSPFYWGRFVKMFREYWSCFCHFFPVCLFVPWFCTSHCVLIIIKQAIFKAAGWWRLTPLNVLVYFLGLLVKPFWLCCCYSYMCRRMFLLIILTFNFRKLTDNIDRSSPKVYLISNYFSLSHIM